MLADATDCREFDVLAAVLTSGFGVPVVRLSRTDVNPAPPSAPPSPAHCASGAAADSLPVHPTVVWLRHASAHALAGSVDGTRSVPPVWARACSLLLQQLAALSASALPGVEPPPARQLADARRLGICVPRTIFTTDIRAAVTALGSPQVVVKSPGPRWTEPTHEHGFGPAVVLGPHDALPDRVDGTPPLAVQEYVNHTRELRVYYLAGGVCAFEVHKPTPASLWEDSDRVYVTPVGCPPPVRHVVEVLATAWNLRYGAFDLLETSSGDAVFLEVNVDGDWLYFERKAGSDGVTLMAAAMVYEQHVRAA